MSQETKSRGGITGYVRNIFNSKSERKVPSGFSGQIDFQNNKDQLDVVYVSAKTFHLDSQNWRQGGSALKATNVVGLDSVTEKFLTELGYQPELSNMLVSMKGRKEDKPVLLNGTTESQEFVMAFTTKANLDPKLLEGSSWTVTEDMMALVRPVQLEEGSNTLPVLDREVNKRIEMIILRPDKTEDQPKLSPVDNKNMFNEPKGVFEDYRDRPISPSEFTVQIPGMEDRKAA